MKLSLALVIVLLLLVGCAIPGIAAAPRLIAPGGYVILHQDLTGAYADIAVAAPVDSDLRADAIAMHDMVAGLGKPARVMMCVQAPPGVAAELGFEVAACNTTLWFNTEGGL